MNGEDKGVLMELTSDQKRVVGRWSRELNNMIHRMVQCWVHTTLWGILNTTIVWSLYANCTTWGTSHYWLLIYSWLLFCLLWQLSNSIPTVVIVFCHENFGHQYFHRIRVTHTIKFYSRIRIVKDNIFRRHDSSYASHNNIVLKPSTVHAHTASDPDGQLHTKNFAMSVTRRWSLITRARCPMLCERALFLMRRCR